MKILIVDDEPLIRLGLALQAEGWGYEVLEANGADEAISLLEKYDDVRVVVTDVDMPGSMDGLKLAHHVRGRWPPIGLIVVSGKLAIEKTKPPQGARFIPKPFRNEVVEKAIREITL